ncbi:hypothetical protein AHAS_Ahas16G0261900 [Arachis hypogaea]
MNNMVLRGKRMFVAEARYRRKSDVEETKGKEIESATRQGEEYSMQQKHREPRKEEEKVEKMPRETVVKDSNKNGWTKKIEISVAKDNVVWLQRSIVGGTKTMINFQALLQKIHNEWPCVTHVQELGAYKAMLTFDTVSSAEEAYTFRMNELLKLFHMVWRWDESERSETRRVWLECYGVPLRAWSTETFTKLGGQ